MHKQIAIVVRSNTVYFDFCRIILPKTSCKRNKFHLNKTVALAVCVSGISADVTTSKYILGLLKYLILVNGLYACLVDLTYNVLLHL